jgi:hypothetical protein
MESNAKKIGIILFFQMGQKLQNFLRGHQKIKEYKFFALIR